MFAKIREGSLAYFNWLSIDDNPYPRGSLEHSDWDYGYVRERALDNCDLYTVDEE